ncbi:MAG: high-molecular-weight cytochrome c, partial [uncultured bacterium]
MYGNEYFIMVSRRAWLLLVFLALSMVVAAPAYAELACNVCHGMPPLDSAAGGRQPASGAFKGNHQRHSSDSVNSCIPCHGSAVSSYNAAHRGTGSKSVIKITWALNNYSIGHNLAAYSRGTFFNQTTVPPNPLGTCSNVNCHFENSTPDWGTANFVSPTDCDMCHGAPPSGASSGAAGSHAKHDTYYPGVTNCQKCHPNNTTFQHATSAGNRPLAISFAVAPNNGSGVYSGPLNDYLPSQANTFGNCTATYCHSNGKKVLGNFSSNMVASWGGSLTCKGCHKSDNASADIMATGSHGRHVNASKHYTISC